MPSNHLGFNVTIGQKKPESIINTMTKCPFCDRDSLTDILDSSGQLLLIKNKFQVLQDSFQTVLIETTKCTSDISEYTKDHLHDLFRFGVRHWFAMIASKEYQSVLFFKNHGPLSGGTLRHPHMQIIGLKTIDYHTTLDAKEFNGLIIHENDGVEFNISTYPRIGFSEFNVLTNDNGKLDQMADYVQIATHYVLNNFNQHCKSYNLFFYLVDDLIRIKIMPRFATSPLYIGYTIHLIPNNLETIVSDLQTKYFNK